MTTEDVRWPERSDPGAVLIKSIEATLVGRRSLRPELKALETVQFVFNPVL